MEWLILPVLILVVLWFLAKMDIVWPGTGTYFSSDVWIRNKPTQQHLHTIETLFAERDAEDLRAKAPPKNQFEAVVLIDELQNRPRRRSGQ